jgi:hypothetical protein
MITREDILKALNDKIIKETISPFSVGNELSNTKGDVQIQCVGGGITQDNTKATTSAMNVKTEDQQRTGANNQNTRQRVGRGGRLTPHLQMETVGDQSVLLNKTQ